MLDTTQHAIAITELWLKESLGVRDSVESYCHRNRLDFTGSGQIWKVPYAAHGVEGEGGSICIRAASAEIAAMYVFMMPFVVPIGEPVLVEDVCE